MRASPENAREMVADETPTSLASSLEVIRSFTQLAYLVTRRFVLVLVLVVVLESGHAECWSDGVME
jgi:hypothetical protein